LRRYVGYDPSELAIRRKKKCAAIEAIETQYD